MDLPADTSLPFFTYGLFRPDQMCFNDIRQFVERAEAQWEITGTLLERDGLPVLSDEDGIVDGAVLYFKTSFESEAYSAISAVASEKLYRWEQRDARKRGKSQRVNVLLSRKPRRGSHEQESCRWDGRVEPLFTDALTVIEEMLCNNRVIGRHPNDVKPLLRLQMAYTLLWSGIERLTAFKYGASLRPEQRLKKFAEHPVLAVALKEVVQQERAVHRSDDPEKKERLRADDPDASLGYYYQVRCNIVHRGKASYFEYEMLLKSLEELLAIFRRVLETEFRID
jgi:hypothetical protein